MEAYSRWEIVLAWIPSTDGSAANYPHPCIYYARHLEQAYVIGITSDLNQRHDKFSCDLPWAEGRHRETGLDRPSIAQTHWLSLISSSLIRKVIGYTPIAQQFQITDALKRFIDSKRA